MNKRYEYKDVILSLENIFLKLPLELNIIYIAITLMSTKLVGLSIAAIVLAIFAASLSIIDNINSYNPQTRDIYLFSQVDENIDEEKFGIPPDQFSLGSIVVNKGDTVRIHFTNLEPVETQEHHTFTLSAYNIDADINAGEDTIIEFTATETGIFEYVCTYHEPTMTGQLVVLNN